jgi:alpha-beta hydrolase superfamily lysophospholipase
MTRQAAPHSRKRKLLVRLGTVALIVIGIAWLFIWHIAPRAILEPQRNGGGATPPPGIEPVSFKVTDEIALAAWKAVPQNSPRAAVIVLHGIADSKASQHGTLSHLARRGILAIALDLRGHGDSPGLASYGFHEKADLACILDSLENEYPGILVGLCGTSYGGAVALQSAAADPRFDFLIVESTFSSLTEVGREQVSIHAFESLEWLAPIAIARAGKLGNFDPQQIAPAEAMRSITVPVLHLHGESDEIIPFSHALKIKAAAQATNYRFVSVPKAGHYNLRNTDPVTYDKETSRFLDEVSPPP